MNRWRGRLAAGLAAASLLATAVAGAVAMARDDTARSIVVRDAAGAELARAELRPSEGFALRYRNSVYRSIAEERFRVDGDRLRLVELRAEELAVLEEYYTATAADRTSSGSSLEWRVVVERPPIPLPHRVQATALGQRSLVTERVDIPLWKLVEDRDDTLVILSVEETP
ncbi:MAG: hypothetical protein M3153_01595 [Chloroflexota bacterium]|nr:hypothetical protein [Chloroflexota bacterium]